MIVPGCFGLSTVNGEELIADKLVIENNKFVGTYSELENLGVDEDVPYIFLSITRMLDKNSKKFSWAYVLHPEFGAVWLYIEMKKLVS